MKYSLYHHANGCFHPERRAVLMTALVALMTVLATAMATATAESAVHCQSRVERLRYQGNIPAALAAVDACLEKSPDNPELILARAGVLHAKDDLTGALAEYRRALEAGLQGPARRKVRKVVQYLGPLEESGVRIHVENGPAQVYVMSKALGVRCVAEPECTIGRLPGRVRVYVEREGFAPVSEQVTIARNRTTEITLTLEELPSPLQIEVLPRDAAVELDGEIFGRSTDVIAPGEHRLRVSLANFAPHEAVITAHEGKPVEVRVELAELIRVNVSVAEAEVLLDGQPVTPVDGMVALPPGAQKAHVVTARAAGYEDAVAEIPLERPRGYGVDMELTKIVPPEPVRPDPVDPVPRGGWSRGKIAAVATSGTVAAASWGIAAGLGLSALSKWKEVTKKCTKDTHGVLVCPPEVTAEVEVARSRAAGAEVAMALGTAASVGVLAAVSWGEAAPAQGLSRLRKASLGAGAGIAVAAAGLGAWYGVRAGSGGTSIDCTAGCGPEQYARAMEASDNARRANLAFAVAGVAAAGAVQLWLTRPVAGTRAKEGKEAGAVQVTPVLGDGQVGLGITGTLPAALW